MNMSAATRRVRRQSGLLLESLEARLAPRFFSPRIFDTGRSPLSVAVGEFNGDGRPDLATANIASNTVSVLLGTGDGSFEPARHLGVGSRPAAVAAGELNGDGLQDLAVAHASSGGSTASVLLGTGDGSFQAPLSFATGVNSVFVAVRDINGDGRPDLTVANSGTSPSYQDGSVSVLLGNGDGSFQDARNVWAGTSPYSVAVADVNGDGRPDLAVANHFGTTASVLLGRGDGSFQSPQGFWTGGSYPNFVVVGEFNGDGRFDLVVANRGSANVCLLLGSGYGTFHFARTVPVGTSPRSVAVGDVNGDGRSDLVVANWGSGSVSVLLGNGDGTFQATLSFPAGGSPFSIALADFDADNFPDLATANYGSNTASLLLNKPVEYFYLYPDSGPATAGTPFDLFVFALDGSFNLVPAYTGQVWFWTTDPLATTPELYRFRPEDQGTAFFPSGLTLRTPGRQVVYAFDTSTYQVIGYAAYDVVGTGPGGSPGSPDGAALQDVSTALARFAEEGLGRACSPAAPPVVEGEQSAWTAFPGLERDARPTPAAVGAPIQTVPRSRALLDYVFAESEDDNVVHEPRFTRTDEEAVLWEQV